jgi:hypothetical protein
MDKLEVEILDDGTLKITSGRVSMANHMNAEAFLREMGRMCGGRVERKQRKGVMAQAHSHDHGTTFHSHN